MIDRMIQGGILWQRDGADDWDGRKTEDGKGMFEEDKEKYWDLRTKTERNGELCGRMQGDDEKERRRFTQ